MPDVAPAVAAAYVTVGLQVVAELVWMDWQGVGLAKAVRVSAQRPPLAPKGPKVQSGRTLRIGDFKNH